MQCYVKVLKVGKSVEGEVLISLGEYSLTCFSTGYDYIVEEGKIYLAELTPFYIDGPVLVESKSKITSITQIADSFAYQLTGVMNNDIVFLKGFYLQDEYFLSGFGYLDRKMIDFTIDRIDIEFL